MANQEGQQGRGQSGGQTGSSGGGFGGMDPDKQRDIAAEGGRSVPDDQRSFAQDRELASEAGRKGGEASAGQPDQDDQADRGGAGGQGIDQPDGSPDRQRDARSDTGMTGEQ